MELGLAALAARGGGSTLTVGPVDSVAEVGAVAPLRGSTTVVVDAGVGAPAGITLTLPPLEGPLLPASRAGGGVPMLATMGGAYADRAAVPGMMTVAAGGTGSSCVLSQPAASSTDGEAGLANHRREPR